MGRVMTAEQAAALIKDEDTLWVISMGNGVGEPGKVLEAIEKRFVATGHPRALTLVHPSGMGDGKGSGDDLFAHEGMVRRAIGGHFGLAPKLSQMIIDGKVEGYVVPQGVMAQLPRAIAGGRPGLITHVGLGTFLDPRQEGGRLSDRSRAELVKVIHLEGKEWLFYKSFPVNAAVIRGTTADEDGNITMEHEGTVYEALPLAQAAKNSGGIVIAQVKRLTTRNSLDPRMVEVPGILVDAVVVEPRQMQSCEVAYNPAYSGEIREPLQNLEPMPLNESKIVVRRAAMELFPGAIVNLGFGMCDGVAAIAAEEGVSDAITLTVEQGVIGGVPATGVNFSMAANPVAIVRQDSQFDWYDGGGLDLTFLSFAEADSHGNVNVSRFANRIIGVGGFTNISQNAKKVVFCGYFSASGLKTAIADGKLQILAEGRFKKMVQRVQQITFSGEYARQKGQSVLYVTERAVFDLRPEGMLLTEIAPGIDLENEILTRMDFKPIVSPNLKQMDSTIFVEKPMGLKNRVNAKAI